jgi:hypothetical protein
MEGSIAISKDELMLTAIDGQLTQGELTLQFGCMAFDLSARFLSSVALSRDVDVTVWVCDKADLTWCGLLWWWLVTPRVITWDSNLCLGSFLNVADMSVVSASNEREEFGRNRFQSKVNVRSTLFHDRLDFAARHLSCYSVAFNKHINSDAVVIFVTGSGFLGLGYLNASASSLLNVLYYGSSTTNDVGSCGCGYRHTNRLLDEALAKKLFPF